MGQFVGFTPDGYTSTVTGYASLNRKCKLGVITDPSTGLRDDNTGAHVCTSMEIINSYNIGSPIVAAASGTGLLNSGPPGLTVFSNDCNGWTVRTADYTGFAAFSSVWSFDSDAGSLAACDDAFENDFVKLACCQ